MLSTNLRVRSWLAQMKLPVEIKEINEQMRWEAQAELGLYKIRSGKVFEGAVEYFQGLKNAKTKRSVIKYLVLLASSSDHIRFLLNRVTRFYRRSVGRSG